MEDPTVPWMEPEDVRRLEPYVTGGAELNYAQLCGLWNRLEITLFL